MKLLLALLPLLAYAAPNLTCAQGDSLTYYAVVREFTGVSLEAAVAYFSNWTNVVDGTIVNSTGSSEIGATRTFANGKDGVIVSEKLINVSTSSTVALHQTWTSLAPLTVSNTSIVFSSFVDDLSVYSNATTNGTTVQLYTNSCVNDQATGLTLAKADLDAEIAFYYSMLSSNGTAIASASASASAA